MRAIVTLFLMLALFFLSSCSKINNNNYSNELKYNWSCTNAEKYLRDQEYDAAINNYKDAIALKIKNPRAYIGLGDAYFEKGNFKDALNTYTKASKLFPDNITLKEKINDAEEMIESANQLKEAQSKNELQNKDHIKESPSNSESPDNNTNGPR